MNTVSVSVHIVTYNSAKDIVGCIEAVCKQTIPIDSIIIIDNASTDETNQVIESLRNTYPFTFIKNNANTGFAAAHNQAIRATNSTYVLVLNPDVLLHPDYLHYAIDSMNKDKRIGSITGKLILTDNHRKIDSTGLRIKKNRQAVDRGANETDNKQWDQQTEVFGVSGAAALYHRKMIEDISIDESFFDESFFAYKEDVDVAWRSQLFGWTAKYEPKAIGLHARGWGEKKDRNNIPLKIKQHSYINRYYMMIKNDSIVYIFLHLPFILSYEILSFSYILVKEKKLLASWRNLLELRLDLLRKRSFIQQNRKANYKEIYKYFK